MDLHSQNLVVVPNQEYGQCHKPSSRQDEQIEELADTDQSHERNENVPGSAATLSTSAS